MRIIIGYLAGAMMGAAIMGLVAGSKEHYLCDNDIWQLFVDEEHWDIRKGEKVG